MNVDDQTQARVEEFQAGFEDRKAAKLDRVAQYAENAAKRSVDAHARSNALVEHIPMGQPILVGHHSEKGHRRALDRSWALLGKSVEEGRKAEKWEHVADSIENDTAIHYDDPDAPEKIEARVADLEFKQKHMKAMNAAYRAFIKKPASLESSGLSEKSQAAIRKFTPEVCAKQPFPGYCLTNNSANIRRLKARLTIIPQQLARAVNGRWLYWLKRGGQCGGCGKDIPQGNGRAYWIRAERALYCEECGKALDA